MKKIILLFIIIVCLNAQKFDNKASELAYMMAKASNDAAAKFDPLNDRVKVFKTVAKGNVVISSRQELTKNKEEILEVKIPYIEAYNKHMCQMGGKKLLSLGVVLVNNTYDKNGELVFSNKVKCDRMNE